MNPKFCPQCGQALSRAVPVGDHHERPICTVCNYTHYDSPKIIVACLATWEHKLLWIRRGTEPRKGFWAIPSGFAEQGETPEQAAARELREETGAQIQPGSLKLFLVGALPEMNQVYLVYRGELLSPEFHTTTEADEVSLLAQDEVPWSEYVYPIVEEPIRQFYIDHANDNYGVYSGCVQDGKHSLVRTCNPQ